jgi:CHASE2 domain-containing sensor protein
MEDVEAAEAKMNEAKDALLKYIEARESIDRDRHARLVARLKKAQAEFLKVLSQLGQ